jgi:hypothetical protein
MKKYERVGSHYNSYQNQIEKAKTKKEKEEITQYYINNCLWMIDNIVIKKCPECPKEKV